MLPEGIGKEDATQAFLAFVLTLALAAPAGAQQVVKIRFAGDLPPENSNYRE